MHSHRRHVTARRQSPVAAILRGASASVREDARLLADGKVSVSIQRLRAALGVFHYQYGPIGEVQFVPADYPVPLTLVDASEAGELFTFRGVPTPSGEPNALVVYRAGGFETVNMFAFVPNGDEMILAHQLAVCAWTAEELGLPDRS